MSATKSFIESLDDSEICFLARYKKNQYLPATQKLIEEELIRRRISPALIEEVIKRVSDTQFPPEEIGMRCPRCKSDKWYAVIEESEENRGYTSGVHIVHNYSRESLEELPTSQLNQVVYYDRCAICDYSLNGPQPAPSNKNPIIKKLLKWFD